MVEKELRSWRKVFESDLPYISYELKQEVEMPALIILDGPLGAGKTTFAKNFIDKENDEGTMSPTYSILYESGDILHGDFYRIKERDEIIQLEIGEYVENKQFFLVEWGKKFIHSIYKELPEEFKVYFLEISINDVCSSNGLKSRNFELIEVSGL